jgi:FkbM family methyltransferase
MTPEVRAVQVLNKRCLVLGSLFRATLRRFGYELSQYPITNWEMRPYQLRNSIVEVLTSLQINCILDVGANEGQYANLLRSFGYAGRVISFEPVSTTYNRLARQSSSDPNWAVHNCAVGSCNGSLEMNIMDGDQFSSLLSLNSYGRTQFPTQTRVARTERVNVVRLDSIMDAITEGLDEPKIFLKIDTQGYDLEVVEGAAGCIGSILGLQSEIALRPIYEKMPNYLTSLTKLNELGFSITSLVPVSRDSDLRVIEFDCFLVRTELAGMSGSPTKTASCAGPN